MTTEEIKRFAPGQKVYARWHGENTFTVIREAHVSTDGKQTLLPHYVCRLDSLYAATQHWIIPMLQLSTKSIETITKSHNRKQLSLLTDVNLSNSTRS